MNLIADRRSVHAGDDGSPHDVDVSLAVGATVADAVSALDLDRFLPWFSASCGRHHRHHGRWTISLYDTTTWRRGGPAASAAGRRVATYDDDRDTPVAYDGSVRPDTRLADLVDLTAATPVLYFD